MGDVEGWLWHLFNDPVRDNPWSLGLLILMSAVTVAGMAVPTLIAVRDGRKMREERERDMKIFSGKGDEGDPRYDTEDGRHALPGDPRTGTSTGLGGSGGEAATVTFINDGEDGSGPAGSAFVTETHTTTDGAVTSIRPLVGVNAGAQRTPEKTPPAPDPVADSGVHAMPERSPAVLSGHKVSCTECRGYGYVIMSTRDVLQQVKPLLDEAGPMVVREFYTRLLHAAPGLATLFPADLLTDDSIKKQREKLLGALKALIMLYDPDDDVSMEKLTTALRSFGRSHASFDRQDGSSRGATFDEYGAVKAALFGTLHDAAGPEWKPEFDPALSEAFDFAAVTMLAEQYATVTAIARQPRQSAAEPLRGVMQ